MEAFAWDMETNVRQTKVFQVPHVRHTKKGSYNLEDPREIYEMTANQGARRLRACILGIIPGDIIEDAVIECEKTMKAKADTGPEGIKRMLAAFEQAGVNKEQIEKRIQRRIDTITAAQMISLKKVLNSLKDNMSAISDWFEIPEQTELKKTGVEGAKEALKTGQKTKPAPQEGPKETEKVQRGAPPDERPDSTQIPCPMDPEMKPADLGYCRRNCVSAVDCTAWLL